jgi:hypothetical protein
MPGPLRKPVEIRQGREMRPVIGMVATVGGAPPPPCRGWRKQTAERWAAFWGSSLAGAVDRATDMPALVRLFTGYNEVEVVGRKFRKARLATGSTGQETLHPFAKYLSTLTAEITALEDRFGLTPKARLALGLQVAAAKRTLKDLATVGYDD